MISRYRHGSMTWVDLESPSRAELLHISEEFALPKPVEEELFSPSAQSKVEAYDAFIYIILHFPQEVNFVIGRHFILTARYEANTTLNEFAGFFESTELFDQHQRVSDGGALFAKMMQQFCETSLKELGTITDRVSEVEKNIFNDKERVVIKIIPHTNRKLLIFKQRLLSQIDVLHSYEIASKQLFGEPSKYHTGLIMSAYTIINNTLEGHQELLQNLRHTNDSLLSIKTHKQLRTLTILAIIIGIMILIGLFKFII